MERTNQKRSPRGVLRHQREGNSPRVFHRGRRTAELLGQNGAPNPQELLMAAFNACIMVGYLATASVMGIRLDSVEIDTEGELGLRGFLGIDPNVKPGYDSIRYTVRLKGD